MAIAEDIGLDDDIFAAYPLDGKAAAVDRWCDPLDDDPSAALWSVWKRMRMRVNGMGTA